MSLDMRMSSGWQCLAEALYRRFITVFGSWPVDRNYGYSLEEELNETDPDPNAIARRIEAECEKDERVESALASALFDENSETLTATVECQTAEGPFVFTLKATSLTVELLSEQIDTTLGL